MGPLAMKKTKPLPSRCPQWLGGGYARGKKTGKGTEHQKAFGFTLRRRLLSQGMNWPLCIIYRTSLRLLHLLAIHCPASAQVTFCKQNQSCSFSCFKPPIVSACTETKIQTPKTLEETKHLNTKEISAKYVYLKKKCDFFSNPFYLQSLVCGGGVIPSPD